MNLPAALLTEAKRQAATEGRTLTSLVEEALRARLSQPARRASTRTKLPSWAGASAAGHLVDLRDKQAVWEVLDAVQ
ncbi:hypothetical protein BH24ACT9_BH24ACT9_11490 [soil metagenome]